MVRNSVSEAFRPTTPMQDKMTRLKPPLPDLPLEDIIEATWKRVLNKERIDHNEPYSAIGGGAKRALRIISELKQETGVELPLSIFCSAPTIVGMAAALSDGSFAQEPALNLLKQGEAGFAPIFLFPGIGGALIEMLDLADALSDRNPIYGLNALCSDKDVKQRTVLDLAAAALAEIEKVRPLGPYHLVGFSFGGCIALEVARALSAKGQIVGFIGLIEPNIQQRYWPWHVFIRDILWRLSRRDFPSLAQKMRASPMSNAENNAIAPPKALGTGTDAANGGKGFASRLLSLLRKKMTWICGDPFAKDFAKSSPYYIAGLPTLFQRLRDADISAFSAYRPKPYVGPVSYFASTYGDLLSCLPGAVWPTLLHSVEWFDLPGDHGGLMRRGVVELIAAEVIKGVEHADSAVGH